LWIFEYRSQEGRQEFNLSLKFKRVPRRPRSKPNQQPLATALQGVALLKDPQSAIPDPQSQFELRNSQSVIPKCYVRNRTLNLH
jgi:hypothetical protein